jgi:hypothetical protein
LLLGDAKQLAVAVRVGRRCRSGHNGAGRRCHDGDDVFVAVGINTEHVVQFVCKHQTRSSDSFVGSGGAGLKRGKPRRQDGNESRR